MADLYSRKQFELHEKEAIKRFPGPKYFKVLEWVHGIVRPHLYVEIGVSRGDSLKLVPSTAKAIGIDPAPRCKSRSNARIFEMTSDDFFAQADAGAIPGVENISLSFIDGLHTYDQALRDFVNLEKLSAPGSAIMFHDCIPLDEATAANPREAQFYTGDVWKTMLILVRKRPDLKIGIVPTWPSGLAIVTKLNPKSTVLQEELPNLVEEYRPLGFGDYHSILNELPTEIRIDPSAIRQFLHS
ncbi:MAG TPA: class I SAM-dependent methyltransferase [Edaphobacter sp.]|jgi:hypothetical protein|nr:class I SAM-dependent methyltransferase [Edaphobacter sp.]